MNKRYWEKEFEKEFVMTRPDDGRKFLMGSWEKLKEFIKKVEDKAKEGKEELETDNLKKWHYYNALLIKSERERKDRAKND